MSEMTVTSTRVEYWKRIDPDGVERTAAVEVGENFGLQVVVVSLELLRQMLSDLGFAMQPENDFVDAPEPLSGSNTRSVAPGDAETLQGAQNGAQRFSDRKPMHDESEGDRG